jgi:hypothetical protein
LIPGSQKEDFMAQRNPDDPYRPNPFPDDPRTPSQLDTELQVDPEMNEGPVTMGRIALFAVAIVLVFGAVFYGMNTSSTNPNSPAVATQTAPPPANQTNAQTAPVAPGVRDVTPRNAQTNAQPGVTTGAAPAAPATAPNRPADAVGSTR